ncbi:hypothetical protein AVEN_23866-1, partial [Araneus ventricosus]
LLGSHVQVEKVSAAASGGFRDVRLPSSSSDGWPEHRKYLSVQRQSQRQRYVKPPMSLFLISTHGCG